MSVAIRPMLPDEAASVTEPHRTGIPQGFLSQLPPGVLTAVYRGIARSPKAGVWTAIADSGKVVGFIASTANVSSCYRGALRRKLPAILWHILPSLLTVSTWRRACNTLTYPRREIQRRPGEVRPEPTGELLAIVVAAEARGTGAGARLVQSLEDGLRRWGYAGPYRVVTAADDPRSNGFYAKIGFRPARDFMHHANRMRLYHKDLPRG